MPAPRMIATGTMPVVTMITTVTAVFRHFECSVNDWSKSCSVNLYIASDDTAHARH
jgi:hypothetical protein